MRVRRKRTLHTFSKQFPDIFARDGRGGLTFVIFRLLYFMNGFFIDDSYDLDPWTCNACCPIKCCFYGIQFDSSIAGTVRIKNRFYELSMAFTLQLQYAIFSAKFTLQLKGVRGYGSRNLSTQQKWCDVTNICAETEKCSVINGNIVPTTVHQPIWICYHTQRTTSNNTTKSETSTHIMSC